MVNLTEVYALLTAPRMEITRARLNRRVVNSSRPIPAINDMLDIALIDARRLDDDKALAETRALFDAGMPVAVFTPRGASAAERSRVNKLFGAASEADLAIYVRNESGSVRVFSTPIDRSLAYPDTATRIGHFQRDVAAHIAGMTHGQGRAAIQVRAVDAGNSSNPDYLPIIELTDTTYGRDGQSLTREITVVRDSTASRDNFNVTLKTSGLIKGGDDESYCTLKSPSGHILKRFRCAGYTASYMVDALLDYGANPKPTVLRTLPETTGLSDVVYNRTESSTTNFGFNIGADAEKALSGQPSNALKPSFGFNFGKSYTKSTSITVDLKDYSTSVESKNEVPNFYPCPSCLSGLRNTWRYRLSDVIRDEARWGVKTPAMLKFAPQSYSMWTLPASRAKSPIKISASTSVSQRGWNSGISNGIVRVKADAISIDLDSPYLHREPVVILQSKENRGRCLINDGKGAAKLATCSRDIMNRAGQWYLDAFDRYVSRLDGKCLAVNQYGTRQVEVVSCDDSTRQKWFWASDRINSRINGGDYGWRLFVQGDLVNARIDPRTQQVIPNNPNHVLLDPWSTYPSAPVVGATIPVVTGPQPQVPQDWVRRLKNVPSNERWQPIALRQYKED